MPELPEVEVTRQGLLPNLPGKTVKKLWWSGKKLRTDIRYSDITKALCGQKIKTIDRRAKYLLLRFENGSILVIHLGMTGRLSYISSSTPRRPHDHFVLLLTNAMELRFNDSRRFGSITVWMADQAKEQESKFSAQQGLEPLNEQFTGKALLDLAKNRKVAVKNFLMNSRIVAGIGNIYASEILFQAKIHPACPANKVSLKQWQNIATAAKEILQKAIAAGGTTISDFLSSRGTPGYFQVQLNVYGKKGDSCPQCGTSIAKEVLGGRSSYFCPACQPAPNIPSAKRDRITT